MKNYYIDMDGVIANFHKEPYKYANAINREWIANLEPFTEAIAKVKQLIKDGNEIFINSLCASENAKLGKLDWLEKYLPEIKKENIIIIVGSGRKSDYMKTKDGILVDDKESNCKQWEKLTGQPTVWVKEKGKIPM